MSMPWHYTERRVLLSMHAVTKALAAKPTHTLWRHTGRSELPEWIFLLHKTEAAIAFNNCILVHCLAMVAYRFCIA